MISILTIQSYAKDTDLSKYKGNSRHSTENIAEDPVLKSNCVFFWQLEVKMVHPYCLSGETLKYAQFSLKENLP